MRGILKLLSFFRDGNYTIKVVRESMSVPTLSIFKSRIILFECSIVKRRNGACSSHLGEPMITVGCIADGNEGRFKKIAYTLGLEENSNI